MGICSVHVPITRASVMSFYMLSDCEDTHKKEILRRA